MDRTDQELWRAYNSGDPQGFEFLFQRHKGKIFNFSLRYLDNRAEAEDVTSEVFIQLFHKRYKEDGRAKLSTWLFTIARNACLTRLRSAKRMVSLWFHKGKAEGKDLSEWDIPSPEDDPQESLLKKEDRAAVRRALSGLPIEQKEALILREYSRKDYAAIAEILDCTLEKVKILIFRGREKLRVDLAFLIKEDQS